MNAFDDTLAAAARALRACRPDEALTLLDRVRVDAATPRDRLRVDLVRVRALRDQHRTDDALAAATAARARAEAGGWASLLAEGLLVEARVMVTIGRIRAARPRVDRARALAVRLNDLRLQAEAALVEAGALRSLGDVDAAIRGYRRCVALAEQAGEPVIGASALRWLSYAHVRSGELGPGRQLAERALVAARAADDLREAHEALRLLGSCALTAGDLASALKTFDTVVAFARERNRPHLLQRVLGERGEARQRAGDVDGAVVDWTEATTLLPGPGSALGARLNLAWACELRGEHAAARDALLAAEADLPAAHAGAVAGPVATMLLAPLAALGDGDALDERLVLAERYAARGPTDEDLVSALLRAHAALGDAPADRARASRVALAAARMASRLPRPSLVARAAATLDALAAERAPVPLGAVDLVGLLGRGGMGAVWEGTDRDTGGDVAVKVRLADGDDSTALAFREEVHAIARLAHPAIVPVLDAGVVDAPTARLSGDRLHEGDVYVVMQRADRGPLSAWCGRLAWVAARRVLDRVLAALGRAHAHGIAHCDVKPANVLLAGADAADGAPRHVWLADFGVARRVGVENRRATGTPEYMAPEQFVAGARLTPATDLYAVGCLAAALVQGHAPFPSREPSTLAQHHRYSPPPPLAPVIAVPPGLEGWVRRTLAKDPRDRFTSAALAREALAALGDAVSTPGGNHRPLPAVGATFDLDALPTELVQPLARDHLADTRLRPLPDAWPPAEYAAPGGLGLLGLREPPFVGRDSARAHLWRALRAVAHAGEPGRVRVVGPAGSGRSRLLAWLCRTVREHGFARAAQVQVLGHRDLAEVCRELAMATLALPSRTDPAALVTALAPRIGRTRATRVARWLASSEPDPRPVFGALLEAFAADGPAVLAVDDLHRRPALADLLARASTCGAPVLLVESALHADALDPVPTITLDPLPPGPIAALLDGMVPLAPSVRDAVGERAGGMPGVAVQLLEDLGARGALVRDGATYRLRSRATFDWPASAHAGWMRRTARLVEGLGPHARRVLALAAMLGPGVDGRTWRRAAGPDVEACEPLHDRLASAGLAYGDADDWRFAHPGLPDSLRRWATDRGLAPDLHVACAAALPDGHPARGEHLLAAGEVARAAPLLRAAVEDAILRGASHEARRRVEAWRDALEAAGTPWNAADRIHADLLHVDARIVVGELDGTDGEARLLVGRAADGGHTDLETFGWIVLGQIALQRARYDDARGAFDRAATLAPTIGLRGRALRGLAAAEQFEGHPERAAPLYEAAIAACEAAGDTARADRARANLGTLLLEVGRLDEAERRLDAVATRFEASGILVRLASVRNDLGDVYRIRGELDRADAAYADAQATLELMGSNAAQVARANRALVTLARGDGRGFTALHRETGLLARRGRGDLADLFLTTSLPFALGRPDLEDHVAAAERAASAGMFTHDLRIAVQAAAGRAPPAVAARLAALL